MINSTWDESWLDVGSHDTSDLRFDNPSLLRFTGRQNLEFESGESKVEGNVSSKKRKRNSLSMISGSQYPDEPLHYKYPGYNPQRTKPKYRSRIVDNKEASKEGVLPPSPGDTSSTDSDSRAVRQSVEADVEEEFRTEQLVQHYLKFENSDLNSCLIDEAGSAIKISVESNFSGNWYLTDGNKHNNGVGNTSGDIESDSRKRQLTFYRRNLFDIRSTCTFDSKPVYVIANDKARVMIDSFELAIELFSSSDKRKNVSVVARTGIPVSNRIVKIDDESIVSGLSICHEWNKVKFSAATVNNGAPNCQPYFQVQVILRAVSFSGESIDILKASSQPIVVRGRHPQFYQDRFGISLAYSDSKRKPSISSGSGGSSSKSAASEGNNDKKDFKTSNLGLNTKRMKNAANEMSTKITGKHANNNNLIKRSILPATSPPTPPLEGVYENNASGYNEYYYFPLDRVSPEEMVEGFYNPHFPHQSYNVAERESSKTTSYYRNYEEDEWSYDEKDN